jgi:hypothetical protein
MGSALGRAAPPQRLLGHTDRVTSVAFSKNDGPDVLLISTSADGTVRRYERWENGTTWVEKSPEGGLKPTVESFATTAVDCVSFHRDGKLAVAGAAVWIYAPDRVGNNPERRDARWMPDHTVPDKLLRGASWVDFMRDGKMLARTSDGCKSLILFDQDGEFRPGVYEEYTSCDAPVQCIATANATESMNNFIVLSGTTIVSKYHTGEAEEIVGDGHTHVVDIEVSPADNMILAADFTEDSTIPVVKVWKADSRSRLVGTCTTTDITAAEEKTTTVTCARFAPSSNVIAAGFSDGSIRYFDVSAANIAASTEGWNDDAAVCKQLNATIRGSHVQSIGGRHSLRDHAVTCLAFSPLGDCLVSGSADSSVCVHKTPFLCLTDGGKEAASFTVTCCSE